jgi:O-antigen ligase
MSFLISPEFAIQEKGIWRLRGVFFHEFELGFVSSMVLIILCIRWCNSQVIQQYSNNLNFYLLFAISFITLLATQTRTLLAYTFIVCLVALIFFAKGKKRIVTGGIFIIGMSGAFIMQDSFISAFSRGESDATLSGRTIIWDRALKIAEQSPTLGFGYGSFTASRFDADMTGFYGTYRAPHAHNTWIMSYFETGIIGVTILSIFLVLQLIYGLLLARKEKQASYGLFFALLATIAGFTSLVYAGNVAALSFLPIIFLFQRSREIGWNVKFKSIAKAAQIK